MGGSGDGTLQARVVPTAPLDLFTLFLSSQLPLPWEPGQVLLICVLASSGGGMATGHLKKEDKPNGPHSVLGTVLNP